MQPYPLKFTPILKKIIWGGSEICRFKQLDALESGVGESWELSQVPGSVSVVANGPLKDRTLTEVLDADPVLWMGKSVYERFGKSFPLLIKFIDAQDDLSIQVHPGDALARARHDSFGKTEMWYVMDAKPGSRLISGFSRAITAAEYERRIAESTINEVLQTHEVKSGDVFFLPAGRVHAICSGLFIAEIQQSSNVTYRLYDYNRKDAQGNVRELHTELAREAICFDDVQGQRLEYTPVENGSVELVKCPYFTTTRIHLKALKALNADAASDAEGRAEDGIRMNMDYSRWDSFVVYVCMKGDGYIVYGEEQRLNVRQGETVLVPAALNNVVLFTRRELLLLETHI